MALQPSLGYAGSAGVGKDWAEAQWGLGARYWCKDQDHVKVTPLVGGTRQVRISAGHFGGWGVKDYNDAPIDLTLPTVASGTKDFLICARRTWGTTNLTTFVAIPCGARNGNDPTYPVIGASDSGPRYGNPGVVDDQPLAFVSLTAGQTNPNPTVRDVRALGINKQTIVIIDELATGYLEELGTELLLNRTRWSRVINSSGLPVWLKSGPDVRLPLYPLGAYGSSQTGWTTSAFNGATDQWLDQRLLSNGNDFELSFAIRRIGASLPVSDGHIVDQIMMKLTNPAHWPEYPVDESCTYITSGGRNVLGGVTVRPSGDIAFTSGQGDWPIAQMTSSWTVRAQFKWTKASAS